MPKDLRVSILLDFYGEILTGTQRETVDAYYNQDMSLSEIAGDRGISRQGVRDAIKRAEQQLIEMEEKLGLVKRFQDVQRALEEICDCALEIQELNARNGGVEDIDRDAQSILEYAQEIADKLSEGDVKEAMREVRLALLEADVNYKVAKELTGKITERAVGEEVMESLTPAQMVIKIVNEELTALMGGTGERLKSLAGRGQNHTRGEACVYVEVPGP